MLCRKAMSCFLDSTCDSSTKLQNLGFCKRQIGIIYFAHTVTNSFGLMTQLFMYRHYYFSYEEKQTMIDDPLFKDHSPHFEKYTMQECFSVTSLRIPIVSLWITPYMFLLVFSIRT